MNPPLPLVCVVDASIKSRRGAKPRPPLSARWALCLLTALLCAPAIVRADNVKDDGETIDARVYSYGQGMWMKSTGIGMTTILFLGLSVLGCGVLFKNANRSHLD